MQITFERATAFHQEVKARVAEYFARTGARPRDLPRMYLKTAAILAWFAVSYYLLVFAAATWWQAAGAGDPGLRDAALHALQPRRQDRLRREHRRAPHLGR